MPERLEQPELPERLELPELPELPEPPEGPELYDVLVVGALRASRRPRGWAP